MTESTDTLSGKDQLAVLDRNKAFPYMFFAIVGIGVLILFRKFIFSDLMLYGSDMLNAGVFFREMLVEHVRSNGGPPRWNPYIFGGMPYVDAFHGDIFYPFSSLKYFGNLFRMLGWNLVLHIFLAGVFMYWTAREFALSRVASVVAAVCYGFSGYLVSLVAPGHDGKIFVTTLFPLAILFLDRAFNRRALLNFTLLGVVIGLIILTPHPQMSYFTLWALGFYVLYLLYQRFKSVRASGAGSPVMPLATHGGGFALAVVLGLGISAIQFYPGVQYTKQFSPRTDTKSGWQWATSWSMHTEGVVGLLDPEFVGTSVNKADYPDVHYWGKNAFKDNSEYAGVVALFLGIIGVFFYRRKGIFFGGLALFALSYALGATTPLFKLYFYLIPNVKSLRAPSMIMFIFCFSISLLAAMGVQWILTEYRASQAKTKERFKKYLLIFGGSLGALALLWGLAGESMLGAYTDIFYSGIKSQLVARNVSKWNIAMANLPAVQKGFWISFFLVTASIGVIWGVIRGALPRIVILALPLLAMVDGIRFGDRFIQTVEPQRIRQQFEPNPITDYITKQSDYYRTLQWGIFQGDALPYFGIEVVAGYHGNQLKWYDDLLGGPGMYGNPILKGNALKNFTNARFLNLVGAKYLVLPKRSAFPSDHFGPKPVRLALDLGNVAVYENPNAFPRAFLPDTIVTIAERRAIYPQILRGNANLREVAFVEETSPEWQAALQQLYQIQTNNSQENSDSTKLDTAKDVVKVVSTDMDSIVVSYNVQTSRPVIVTTAYYNGWRPYVNGEPVDLVRADGAFLSALVPKGQGTLTFRYASPLYETGRNVTYVSLALTLGLLGLGWWRRDPDELVEEEQTTEE